MTFDFNYISYNLTYGSDYQISVYANCKPCPPRYVCNNAKTPPVCTTPTVAQQTINFNTCLNRYNITSCLTVNGTYTDCDGPNVYVKFAEPDLWKCQQIPWFCSDYEYGDMIWDIQFDSSGQVQGQKYQEQSTFIQNPVENDPYSLTVTGCCQCKRYILPYYFLDALTDEGSTDNKHGFVQLSMVVVADTELTLVVELLDGQFYQDFDENIPGHTDISIFTPYRSKYQPSNIPSRYQFITLIQQSDIQSAGMANPFNLPMQQYLSDGYNPVSIGTSGATNFQFENNILLGRISSLKQGDPQYVGRYKEHKRDVYIQLQSEGQELGNFTDWANIPDLDTISSHLYVVLDPSSYVEYQQIWWSLYEQSGNSFLGLPYLPWFSNCKGGDSYVSLNKVLETDPSCVQVPYEQTVFVNQFFSTGMKPYADQCNETTPTYMQSKVIDGTLQESWLGPYNGAMYDCYFEEDISVTLTTTRWYEAPAQTPLFYIGTDPFGPNDYSSANSNGLWGRSANIYSILGTYKAIPFKVATSSYGQVGLIPRQVQITIYYYQINAGTKRIIKGGVAFAPAYQCVALTTGGAVEQGLINSGFSRCKTDISGKVASSYYLLQIYYQAFSWFDLLNQFAFPAAIYILFFIATGFVTVGSSASLWLINRLLTKLRHPPAFHFNSLMFAIAQPSLFGSLLGIGPVMLAVYFFYAWFMAADDGGTICSADPTNAPSKLCLQDILDWSQSAAPDKLRIGRQQVAIFAIGIYVTMIFVILVVPNYTDEDRKTDVERAALKVKNARAYLEKNIAKAEKQLEKMANKANAEEEDDEDELPPSESWKPWIWNRAAIVFLSLFVQFCLIVQIEFSYSTPFSNLVYQFIVIFQEIYQFLDIFIFGEICPDTLYKVPMNIAINVISNMTTMGAPNFTQFLLSNLASLFLTYANRLYFNPLVEDLQSLWPRWKMMIQRRLRGNKRLTREEKAREELEWRRVNEEIELSSEGIEPVLGALTDYTVDCAGMLVSPIASYVLFMFYHENQIAPLYNILENQIGYYIMYSAFIIPFTYMSDTFLHNCQELIHGWKVYDYLSYQRYRFSVREYRWMLRNPVVDESISEEFQTVDLLCFSSQYYFLITMFSFGMVMMSYNIEAFLRQEYNIFGDPCFLLMFVWVFLTGEGMLWVYARLADVKVKRFNWRGLWATKQIEGTVDDDIAAKLAIGEGKQADLEQERLELQALNSERFRHRFLERNRPWILQHLVELLTPRSLEQPGPDGRPAIEYVRDIYAELMQMGEGLRKPGDRGDISSDEEDDLEAIRRNWPRDPVRGASLAIARMWLAKARKRRAFGKLVRGIIDQNKKTSCEICGRTPEKNNVKLQAYLARNGVPDITAIDELIGGFEDQYGKDETEPQLWKAYFRAHAQYCTRCSVCEDGLAQERLLKAGREPGPTRETRPQDISSDEEDDLKDFEPIVVTRTSPEGRMMSKWLVAARRKLGGTFPRPDARKQMEKYAQKLRELKMKKARDAGMEAPKLPGDEEPESVAVSAATKALAVRWIRLARDHMDSKFRAKSENFRDELENLLNQMPEEDDWYFGAALRLEGKDLLKGGSDLENDRRTLEAEAAVKIHKIENDLKDYIKEREDELEKERKLFLNKLSQQNDQIKLQLEIRKEELEKLKETRKKEFQQIEKKAREELGAAPTEMIQDHRNQLLAIDELMNNEKLNTEKYRSDEENQAKIMFDRAEMIKRNEMERRKAMASENSSRIRQEVAAKVKAAEAEWQSKVAKWLAVARRKVQVKKREDEEAKAGKRKRKGGK
eukprot:CAMPEP_0173133270 /NCGR_PEP_ID=MMETSP1105-20130129/630_1 /TAXON_ID=2985 /ORGANISM="Ochromonas sp., Strain BG-1" /LENGTH=1788 /DNA_ID=CAMNT_0014044913 /DNA_START=1672 /DNA_END=7038 /DNA_ORIENTATION=+